MVRVPISGYNRTSKKGKTFHIKNYKQNRKTNRGKFGKPKMNRSQNTIWLKNRKGEFIGRANRLGKSSAIGITSKGKDKTGTYRELGKGRIIGRYPE